MIKLISPSPATFVLQENLIGGPMHAVKVAMLTVYAIINTGQTISVINFYQ